MTQAQPNIQNLQSQFEQPTNNIDLTSHPLFNDSPGLFIEAMDPNPSVVTSEQSSSEQNSSNIEQIEHQTTPEKQRTPPEMKNYEQSRGTPPPAKEIYEIMKDPAFLSIHQYNLPNFNSLLIERITWYQSSLTIVSSSNRNLLRCTCILPTIPSNYLTRIKTFSPLLLPK